MNKQKIFIFLSFCLAAAGGRAFAVTESGADFLKLGAGSRATSLAEAQAGDTKTTFYQNPAALAFTNPARTNQFTFMHLTSVQDSQLEFLSYTGKFAQKIYWGLGLLYFHIPPIPVTTISDEPIGDLIWRDFALSSAWGKRISSNLGVGATLKYIYRFTENPIFGRTVGTAVALDAGAIYRVFENEKLYVGAALQNYGTKVVYDPPEPKNDTLPEQLKAGLNYLAYSDGINTARMFADIILAKSDKPRPQFACEITLEDGLALRSGYMSKEGDVTGLAAGIGIKYDRYSIDISNHPSGDLGRTTSISLKIEW